MVKVRKERKKIPGMDMLTYAALMTILLAFFIMLSSFIESQKAELLIRATAPFRKSISDLGLNSFIERIGGKDILRSDVEKFMQNFPAKPVDNIHLEKKDNNLLEEDIEFDDAQPQSETYIPTMIKFDPKDYRLNADAKNKLNDFIGLVADRLSKIIVEGRAGREEVGDDKGYMDWYLSSFRAHTVAEYLNNKGGIDTRRISIIGYGKHRPLVEQTTDMGQNSFVGLIILEE